MRAIMIVFSKDVDFEDELLRWLDKKEVGFDFLTCRTNIGD